MLGAAGIFIPEALTKAGILNTPSWFTAGEATYFTDSTTVFVVEIILFAWAEGRRWDYILRCEIISHPHNETGHLFYTMNVFRRRG
jgi:light-harvesting complex I chlorophyll a/b binding protein 2